MPWPNPVTVDGMRVATVIFAVFVELTGSHT